MATQNHQQQEQVQKVMKNSSGIIKSCNGSPNNKDEKEEDMSRSALALFKAKEEEIERRKLQVRDKVLAQLAHFEEATRRLAEIREELEALDDPMTKEVSVVRKRVDAVTKELKPLGLSCQKKEREYKEALEAFNEKNKEKGQLVSKLMELVSESEKTRMKKLEEISKNVELLH